jgi:Bacterial membrane protein YfhO
VEYVLAPAGQQLPQGRTTLTLVFHSPSTWIYRLAGAAPYLTAAGSACSISSRSRDDARVNCAGPAILTRRETYLPGWSATIDGHDAAIRSTDGIFQALTIPAGAHTITFSYAPPGVGWGFLALAAGLGWLLLPGAVRRIAGRHPLPPVIAS